METTAAARSILANVGRVIDGKDEVIEASLVVLLAGGHLLIEDVPGVGKTALARALARSVDGSASRVQFTPDLLPSDITGVSVFDQRTLDFTFRPGAVFANIVIGDEINRASPKTQSALLEAMEEQQVTVDGTTHDLPDPFMVIATQNPFEMDGTYVLPEAQRDRFMACLAMGYPSRAAELEMLEDRSAGDPIDDLKPVVSVAELRELIAAVQATHVSDAVYGYALDVVEATRRHPSLRLGASPRATLQLVRAAKARAAVAARDFVAPDDVKALASIVLAHRVVVARKDVRPADVIADILAATPVP
jgi:MoxR-like ATPase